MRLAATPETSPLQVEVDKLPDATLIALGLVMVLCGIGRTQVYRSISLGKFPRPLKLGTRCSRWRLGEIRAYLSDPLSYRWEGKA